MKFSNFSHKTPHLKGKQHQLDPNLDLKQLVHHATVQYVDRDVDGDVDVYDNPKKKIPDENVSSAQKAQEYSNKLIAKQKGEIKHTKRGMAYEDTMNKEPRIPKKPGQPDKSDKHSDLYTDEDPKGTIQGLGFKDIATAKKSVSKIKNSGRSHAHKIQAAIAMEQRAKVMGKSSESAIFRSFINSMKEKTKKMNEESESKKCKPGYYYCFTNKECKPIPPGFMIDPAGMLAKENGHTVDEACWLGYKQVGMKKKGKRIVPNCVKEEGLRAWFGKSKSDDGKPGWVQSDGSPCANEPGETKTPKCFSRSKLASMSKGEIASAVRRKREQDPGQQSKSGAAKPTYVSTDSPTKKMNENHNAIASGKEKDEEGYMASTEMDTINSAVKKLRKNIKKGDTQLPAWVQSKITKAADYIDTAADYMDSNEMSEESDKKTKGSGTKDACYTKVKSRYSVWPSAYASGALVKCRKVGAANWGNKSESLSQISLKVLEDLNLDEKCWSGYKKKGMKTMFGKRYPNCVKEEEKDTCNHTHKGEVCSMHGKKECPTEVKEATRLQADTGNILAVILSWRGKTYSVRMFFPQVGMPNRKDVTSEIQKIYPGALVLQYKVSSLQPGMPLIQVVNSKSKNYNMNEESAAWQRKEGKNPEGGLNAKGVASYRRENPGSKLQTAVTTEPSKLKPGSKDANRRKSFCARMGGMPGPMKDEKGRPTRKALSLRKWNC